MNETHTPRWPRRWPVAVISLPAAVATWSGWVGLGEMTGFGQVKLLPGIWDTLQINTAVTLPVGVEAYAAYALSAALTSAPVTGPTRRFAWISSVCALALGMGAQIAYHLLRNSHRTAAPWQITTFVSCLPVLVLGLGAVLAHMLHRDRTAAAAADLSHSQPVAAEVTEPVAEVVEPVADEVAEVAPVTTDDGSDLDHIGDLDQAAPVVAERVAGPAEPVADEAPSTGPPEAILDHPDQGPAVLVVAGQTPPADLADAVISARLAGRSEREVADAFGITRYRVSKLAADALSATSTTTPATGSATVNGQAVHTDH